MKKCIDCEHFHIRQEPLPNNYDSGLAECKLYGYVADFFNHRKLNRLTCDDIPKVKELHSPKLIHRIEERLPHEVSELICLKCLDRWIGVYPEKTLLKDIECKCGAVGFVIKTGQTLDGGEQDDIH